MIIKLTYTNALTVPVLLRSSEATGQPLQPGQQLQMTFSATTDALGNAELILICEPGATGETRR